MRQDAVSFFLLLFSDLIIIITVYWPFLKVQYCACLNSCILRCSWAQLNIPRSLSMSRKRLILALCLQPPAKTDNLSWFQLPSEANPPLDLLHLKGYHNELILTALYDITMGWFPQLGIFAQAFWKWASKKSKELIFFHAIFQLENIGVIEFWEIQDQTLRDITVCFIFWIVEHIKEVRCYWT